MFSSSSGFEQSISSRFLAPVILLSPAVLTIPEQNPELDPSRLIILDRGFVPSPSPYKRHKTQSHNDKKG
jgi:hypothetical protein